MRPRSSPAIELIAIGELDDSIFETLAEPLAKRFSTQVYRAEPLPLLHDWYEPERRQYHADLILDTLITRHEKERSTSSNRVLGILDADLFVPESTFLFGQATVGGCCAVIALERLRSTGAGGPSRFQRRILTEATHEIGHTLGLEHCPDPTCVMSFSSTIEESDQKGPGFCDRCESVVRRSMNHSRL